MRAIGLLAVLMIGCGGTGFETGSAAPMGDGGMTESASRTNDAGPVLCVHNPGHVCLAPGTAGWTCLNGTRPELYDTHQICSGDDMGNFCCLSSLDCSYEGSSSQQCGGHAVSFACAPGGPLPDQLNTGLQCASPVYMNAKNQTCCSNRR